MIDLSKQNKFFNLFSLMYAAIRLSILLFVLIAIITSCTSTVYCHAYSGARYNAGQKGYPAKYNPIQGKPRKAH
jgi:hypothetical protein